MKKTGRELMLPLDYPDIDVIRVGEMYYLISTTMHFLPGGEILSSRDLVHWEHETYIFDKLDSTPAQRLEGEEQIYGKGMWAASLRYHKGLFYVCFVCNDTGKTYLYTANDIHGPWKKKEVEGFFHDCSLLFDDDDRIYIVYGNKNVYLTELDESLYGPKQGGIYEKLILTEENDQLGHEGSHLYKIDGRYYLFTIHSRPDRWFRVECCFVADQIEGPYEGGEVFHDDMGYCDQGVAQGGIVDTPDGRWYSILFQDRSASGRFPVLVPVTWKDGFPVFGDDGYMPESFEVADTLSDEEVAKLLPLVGSDDFRYPDRAESMMSQRSAKEEASYRKEYGSYGLKSWWQFNHEPEEGFFELDTKAGKWTVTTNKTCERVVQARNMITQRMTFPNCQVQVTVDASQLKVGDFAGLCALQYSYGLIAMKRTEEGFRIVMLEYDENEEREIVHEELPYEGASATFRIVADYDQMKDTLRFAYRNGTGIWQQVGPDKKVTFNLKHFAGCRAGLAVYATQEKGGSAVFTGFIYN